MSPETPNPQQQAYTKKYRPIPQSELDLNLMVTNSVWGREDVPEELKTRLNQLKPSVDEEGKEGFSIESLWGLLGFYTRDMRLGNLGVFSGELTYAQYHLDLAGDFLQANLVEPFIICLSRVATLLELSQSKGGFLRRRQGTFTAESISNSDEPEKKSLFGTGKKKQGGY